MARILLRDVGLDVPLFVQRETSGGSWLSAISGAAFARPRREFVTLLDRISLDIGDGDRLAILGRNGAGKSTLLQVLSGAYHPTRGTMEVQGSRQALMNMSLGFNPEATVVENILLRGVAMGAPMKEIRSMVEPVLEFAGLEGKASHRLKTLSSGQKMRLGFAISTEVQHDIMLLDEWIGTGDAEFMERARQRMMDRVGGSKILVLATHSLSLIRSICNRAVLIDRGQLKSVGSVHKVVTAYKDLMRRHATQEALRQKRLANLP